MKCKRGTIKYITQSDTSYHQTVITFKWRKLFTTRHMLPHLSAGKLVSDVFALWSVNTQTRMVTNFINPIQTEMCFVARILTNQQIRKRLHGPHSSSPSFCNLAACCTRLSCGSHAANSSTFQSSNAFIISTDSDGVSGNTSMNAIDRVASMLPMLWKCSSKSVFVQLLR